MAPLCPPKRNPELHYCKRQTQGRVRYSPFQEKGGNDDDDQNADHPNQSNEHKCHRNTYSGHVETERGYQHGYLKERAIKVLKRGSVFSKTPGIFGASLSEPHTSVTALRMCVYVYISMV